MPQNFPKGEIYDCHMQLEDPPWLRHEKVYGVRRQGQIYEGKVHQEFSRRYPGYLASPWIQFRDEERDKWCQPDGLLVDPNKGLIVIVEIKLRHTNQACQSLFGLYRPVVLSMFWDLYRVEVLEVCQWYDPATVCDQVPRLSKWPNNPHQDSFNVHICSGR